jgi:surface polysaccharide O-acyltransferase-like enzyme
MISKYYNIVVENKYLLSFVVGLICTILFYLENNRTKNKYENNSYFKLVIFISVSILFVLYIKDKKINIPESNVKIGDPDF